RISWGIVVFLLVLMLFTYKLLPKTQMPDFSVSETLLKIDWNDQINAEENKRLTLELLDAVKEHLVTHTSLVGSQQFLLDRESSLKPSEAILYLQCESPEVLREAERLINNFISKKHPNASFSYGDVDNIFNSIFSKGEGNLVAQLRHTQNLGN